MQDQVLSPDEDGVSNIFCVFFIQNGTAYPIPNYKTLEVMLVERGKTYQIIDEATPDQIKDFDLLLEISKFGSNTFSSAVKSGNKLLS